MTTASVQCPSRLTVRVRCSFDSEKVKLSSDGSDSASEKFRRGYGGAYGGIWWSLRLAGVWSQAVGFVLARLGGIWLHSP
jgi:hypothetical protein